MSPCQSPKMTENTPKIIAFPLVPLKSNKNHAAAAQNFYPDPICHITKSHPHPGRLGCTLVTQAPPSELKNTLKIGAYPYASLKSNWNNVAAASNSYLDSVCHFNQSLLKPWKQLYTSVSQGPPFVPQNDQIHL